MASFGNTGVPTGFDGGHTSHERHVQPAVLPVDGYLYAISHYIRMQGKQVIRPIVYADDSGSPGAFVAVGPETICHADRPDGWLDQVFATEVLLTAGTYWLGAWTGAAEYGITKGYTSLTGGDNRVNFLDAYSQTGDPPTDPFGSTAGHNDTANLSLYGSYVGTTAAPINYQVPIIYGTTMVGNTMTVDRGLWVGNVTGYSYQWKRDGTNIGGETSTTYVYQSGDVGHSLTCEVTATNANGDAAETTAPMVAGYASWSPVYQQYNDPDTIWLFDPDWESVNYADVGTGGVVCTDNQYDTAEGCNPWRVGSSHQIVAGKFINGITGGDDAAKNLYLPGIPLPSGQFTFEFWAKRASDWDTGDSLDLITFGLNENSVYMHLYSNIGGFPKFEFSNRQTEPAAVLEPSTVIQDTYSPVADEWVGYAVTYDGATVTLYRTSSGVAVAVGTGAMEPPFAWTAKLMYQFRILESESHATDDWVISDLRISRLCRTPGVPIPVTAANTVTVTDTPTGASVNRLLRGGVSFPDYGNGLQAAMVSDNVSFTRLSKGVSGTPSKAGAPDATHPSLGHSGAYSYDWRLVDNSYNYLNTLGIPSHDGLQGTPQIVGGTGTPPAPEEALANPGFFMNYMGENNDLPNDFDAYATICADYFYYVTVTRGQPTEGWWFWNEPDITWQGTILEHSQLFGAVEAAVRAIDPNVYLVVPDSGPTDGLNQYLADPTDGLLKYCADNGHRIDGISFHNYSEDYGLAAYIRNNKLAYWLDASGYTENVPDIIVNEWAKAMGFGLQPWGDDTLNKWGFNDFNGSGMATAMAAGQILGYERMTFYTLEPAEITAANAQFLSDALYSDTNRWTGMNVFEIFRRLEG